MARVLRRVGFRQVAIRSATDIRCGIRRDFSIAEIRELIEQQRRAPGFVDERMFSSYIGQCVFATWAALEHSMETGVPLWSRDLVMPTWYSASESLCRLSVMRIAISEVEWFPAPRTLSEACQMVDDPRLVSLRSDVDLLFHRLSVGDFRTVADVKHRVRESSRRFRTKPWAARVGRLVAYLALPSAAVDLLRGGGVVGTGLSVIGFGTQGLADFLERSRRQSWLSLGRDAYDSRHGSARGQG